MLIRLAIIWVIVAGFAAGFAELVDSDGARGPRPSLPCEEWSNPRCDGANLVAPGLRG